MQVIYNFQFENVLIICEKIRIYFEIRMKTLKKNYFLSNKPCKNFLLFFDCTS